jgi:anti-anti-sigma factor
MPLQARSYANAHVVQLAGRLDHDNSEAYRVELLAHIEQHAAGGTAIVLDLSRLQYVSSAGLRVFMLASRQAKAQGSRVLVAAAQPMVAEIFLISRFNLIFSIHQTLREALAAVSAEAAEAFDKA